MRIRNLSRSAAILARAFADNHFHESEEVFEAMWRDLSKELLEQAKNERHKLIQYWSESESESMTYDE